MAVDRESAVRKAEDLVREGKIELAIDEYLRLVEDQPGELGAANALGDLYAKAGNRAAAVAQFVRIGDSHRHSGFVPKAVAFYKKALKVDPASDHALAQLAQIAIEQELYADATLYLNRLLQRRREQNNEAGVAECLARLGGFPTATADAKIAAARASAAHLAQDQAARLWIDAADALERAGRGREAVDVLMQAASLVPDDVALRRRVALACATAGQIDRARAFLSFDTAGDHPDLLLALAEQALADGRDSDARQALERVLAVAPDRRAEADAILPPLAAATAPEPAPPVHQLPQDLVAADTGEIVDLADAFGSGGDEAPVELGTPSLPPEDAVFETVDAAVVDEEPAAMAEPDVSTATDAAPAADELDWSGFPGEAEPAAVETIETTETVETGQPVERVEPVEPVEPIVQDEPAIEAPVVASVPEIAPEAAREPEPETVIEPVIEPERVTEPERAPAPAPAPASAADLESIAALTAAAQNPALQFQASAQLGRLLLRLGREREGLDWLERATQAATSVREQRLDVMYELADALERAGDRARALDVFADLDFDAASYRDVPERMAVLRRALGEGRAT